MRRAAPRRPVALVVLDGWGLAPPGPGNAVALARTPNLDRWALRHPCAVLGAAGEAVGLTEGQMGNSNVGHLNLGAGRVVYQDLARINRALAVGSFRTNPVLVETVRHGAEPGRRLHLMGLVSPGGVHSHQRHLYGLLELARDLGARDVVVHAFLDGRDVPPQSAKEYLAELEEVMAQLGVGRVSTVAGRYWAMDRDRRWDRTERAYRALVAGEGFRAASSIQAVDEAYARGETDEFVAPTVIVGDGRVRPGDAVIFFNFRPDRARQLTRAFVFPDFDAFERPGGHLDLRFATMTVYDATFPVPVAFPPEAVRNTLGEVVSKAGLRQLRIAETEKYAHVTYFFSGGEERPFPGEDRCLIPSPKVTTYDRKPEMSAPAVASEAVERIESGVYDLIVLNFANADMVGHTGDFSAAVKAIEAVDRAAGRVVRATLKQGGVALVLSDHGNAEQMLDGETGQPHTAHTTSPVPLVLVGSGEWERAPASGEGAGSAPSPHGLPAHHPWVRREPDGILADVAPTVLELLGLPQPPEMTGSSLLRLLRERVRGGVG
ncbi:MAG: 2,3-bisphosphoglycerate-independent phosphoglycerate mutase [Firmicutes bacterium]|nr:2,3-bisphosphoglycerate-independent phosphoglycerate mutase [Bacillota bacterium]